MSPKNPSKREKRKQRQQRKRATFESKVSRGKRAVIVEGSVDGDLKSILWSFSLFDHFKTWANDASDCFCEVSQRLQQFEERTWREVQTDRKQNHPVALNRLSDIATRRLAELQLDDVDELWSFRFKGTWRLWGIKDRRIMQVLC